MKARFSSLLMLAALALLVACGGNEKSDKCSAAQVKAGAQCVEGGDDEGTPGTGGGDFLPPPPDDNGGNLPGGGGGDDGLGGGGGGDRENPTGECAEPYDTYTNVSGTTSPCLDATRACMAGCGADDTCINTCLATESEACPQCLGYVRFICPSKNGCMNEFAASNCCFEEKGCSGDPNPNECFNAMCGAEGQQEGVCAQQGSVTSVCGDWTSSIYDECFGATDPDPGNGGDGGTVDPPPQGACADAPAALPDGYTFCTASTKTCLGSCATGDFSCVNDCIASDTAAPIPTQSGGSVDCLYCMAYTEQHCAATSGCGTEYGAYRCCVVDNNCTTQTCVQQNCKAESDAFALCVVNDTPCTDDYSTGKYNVCF